MSADEDSSMEDMDRHEDEEDEDDDILDGSDGMPVDEGVEEDDDEDEDDDDDEDGEDHEDYDDTMEEGEMGLESLVDAEEDEEMIDDDGHEHIATGLIRTDSFMTSFLGRPPTGRSAAHREYRIEFDDGLSGEGAREFFLDPSDRVPNLGGVGAGSHGGRRDGRPSLLRVAGSAEGAGILNPAFVESLPPGDDRRIAGDGGSLDEPAGTTHPLLRRRLSRTNPRNVFGNEDGARNGVGRGSVGRFMFDDIEGLEITANMQHDMQGAAALLQEVGRAFGGLGTEPVEFDAFLNSGGVLRSSAARAFHRDRDRAVPPFLHDRYTYEPYSTGEAEHVYSSSGSTPHRTDRELNRVQGAVSEMLEQIVRAETTVRTAADEMAKDQRRQRAMEEAQKMAENAAESFGREAGEMAAEQRPEPSEAQEVAETETQREDARADTRDRMDTSTEAPTDTPDSNANPSGAVGEPHSSEATVEGQPSRPPEPANTRTRAATEEQLEHARQLGVSARAAERAARIGVSLDAPADMNPSVVEAATRSTGIDPTFLAALPEDMRAEVLTTHFNQVAAAADDSGAGGGTLALNQEFLAALPPDLRAEVLEQEANIVEQRQVRENATASGQGGLPRGEEMDNATFLATLAPELRDEILVTSDERFLSTLPPALSAEARLLRERLQRTPFAWRDSADMDEGGASIPRMRIGRDPHRRAECDWRMTSAGWQLSIPPAKPKVVFKLDSRSVGTLIKLLYVNPPVSNSSLFRILQYACSDQETRRLVVDLVIKCITHEVFSRDVTIPQTIFEISGSAADFSSKISKATLISRGLELLIFLSKKDEKVPELLVASEAAADEPESKGDPHISALMSLLSVHLFQKSTAHLELLVHLLSASTASVARRRAAHRAARDRDTANGENQDGDRDGRQTGTEPIANAQEDPRQDLPPDHGSPQNPDGQNPLQPEQPPMEVRQASAPEGVTVPSQPGTGTAPMEPTEGQTLIEAPSRGAEPECIEEPQGNPLTIPDFQYEDLESLTAVLSRQGCNEKSYQRVLGVLTEISTSPLNRRHSLKALRGALGSLGEAVKLDFDTFLRSISSVSGAKKEKLVLDFSTSAGSAELKLLRVAKTVAALFKSPDDSDAGENADLNQLWSSLGSVLDAVGCNDGESGEKNGNSAKAIVAAMTASEGRGRSRRSWKRSVPPALARLSPVIEAFFVSHSNEEKASQDSSGDSQSNMATGSSRMGSFVEKHRATVNILLRANPALLEGSFRSALRHPHCIDFDNKKSYFRGLIRQRNAEVHAGTVRISVRREQVFEDSYHQLRLRTPDEMKGRLHVQFAGEEGIDAGGVTREWYTILARKIFDANYALFTRSAAKSATYQPNFLSYVNEDHLGFFKFVGRIIGKAIYDGQLLDAYFTRSFYKHMLGIKPNYHDIEALDPDYYKSLLWILENDITGVFDLTMSAEDDELGQMHIVDLVPDGRNVAVTELNKVEYVKLMTELRTTKAIARQISAFLEGFHELIPAEDIKIFNELELELLMSGLPDIDVADLKANIEYTGYTASSPQVNWFWRAISQLGGEDLARLIMFVTGTSKVPLEGFAALQGMNGLQKFQIHKVGGDSERLPAAHTCFNQLDLPEYATYEKLQDKLLIAIREGAEGFGFG